MDRYKDSDQFIEETEVMGQTGHASDRSGTYERPSRSDIGGSGIEQKATSQMWSAQQTGWGQGGTNSSRNQIFRSPVVDAQRGPVGGDHGRSVYDSPPPAASDETYNGGHYQPYERRNQTGLSPEAQQRGTAAGPGFGPAASPDFVHGPGTYPGDGFGPAAGPGFGHGPGTYPGDGFGPAAGPGFGPAAGPGYGPGFGHVAGPGFGPAAGPGYGPGFGHVAAPGYGPLMGQQVLAPPPVPVRHSDLLKPNGKHYFSARTIVFPLTFWITHVLLQSIVLIILMFSSGLFQVIIQNPSSSQADYLKLINPIYGPMLIISSLLQIAVYLPFLLYQKRKNDGYLGLLPKRAVQVPAAVVMALGLVGFANLFIVVIGILGRSLPELQKTLIDYAERASSFSQPSLLMNIISLAILVPIAEEMLFRGIIVGELRRVAPNWVAILVGGLVFSIAHFDAIQSTYVLPVGLVLSAVYVWTDSLLLPIIMHFTFNLVGGIISPMVKQRTTGQLVFDIILYVFMLAGIVIFILMGRRQRQLKAAQASAIRY